MSDSSKNHSSLVLSYLDLRKAIGFLGIALPFVIYFGGRLIFGVGLQRSISAYYHTGMVDVLVGTLFAWGIFLYSYRGYEPIDNIAGHLACVFAIGIALFPTTPLGNVSPEAELVGNIHLLFALAFFTTLIYFSLVLFVKSNQPKPYPQKKQLRNLVYRVCGWTMAICMLGMIVAFFLPDDSALLDWNPTFWFETIAILAFGISWFTKGEAIALLND